MLKINAALPKFPDDRVQILKCIVINIKLMLNENVSTQVKVTN